METLSEERAATREQLMAAWQLYIARVEEQLASGWQEQIERVFEERFAGLAARLETEFRNEASARIAAAVCKAREQARRDTAEEFNRAARRMRRFENEEDWAAAVLEATQGLCCRAALFAVNGQQLTPVRARILDRHTPAAELAVGVALAAAPAFAGAVESRDTIVAMRTPAELSETVASMFPEAASEKAYLFPILASGRVAAVLYAESDEPVVVGGLELVAALASAALDSRGFLARRTGGAFVPISKTALRSGPAGDWSLLSSRDRELHSRAQRFARVQVAELRLYKSQAVKAGRARRNLYSELKEDIDAGRETFRREFVQASPSMVDYFHLELVRTLANDDVSLLGGDYPGPLV